MKVERSIRDVAVGLLAQREHTQDELRRKLAARDFDNAEIETELERLCELDLQSDSRYAESRARSRANRGYGPLHIRNDLRQHGVDDDGIQLAFEALDTDWYASAAHERKKKFGEALPEDMKTRARQQQFLVRRGFDHDQIREAFSP